MYCLVYRSHACVGVAAIASNLKGGEEKDVTSTFYQLAGELFQTLKCKDGSKKSQ